MYTTKNTNIINLNVIKKGLNNMNDLLKAIYEAELYGDIDSDTADMLLSVYTEGENIDIFKKSRVIKKEYKKTMKLAKEYIEDGEYDKAKKELDNGIDLLNDMIDNIRSVDSSMGSFIFGLFTCGLGNIGRTLASALLVTPTLGISSIVNSICVISDNITQIDKKMQEKHAKGDTLNIKDFNLYKNVSLQTLDKYVKKLKDAKKEIDIAKKEGPSENDFTESYDSLVDEILND